MSILGREELDRALLWANRHAYDPMARTRTRWATANWLNIIDTLKRVKKNLSGQGRDLVDSTHRRLLRGALQARDVAYNLALVAKRDGWALSGCACAMRSAVLSLRDIAARRAVQLVGIGERESYRTVLNICSNGQMDSDPNYNSQMLMAFEAGYSTILGAFASNSSKDARRRGKGRPRRHRGGAATQEDDDAANDEGGGAAMQEDDDAADETDERDGAAMQEDDDTGGLCACFACNGNEVSNWDMKCKLRSGCEDAWPKRVICCEEDWPTTATPKKASLMRERFDALVDELRSGASSSSSAEASPTDAEGLTGAQRDKEHAEQLRTTVQSCSWAQLVAAAEEQHQGAADPASEKKTVEGGSGRRSGALLLYGAASALLATMERNNNDDKLQQTCLSGLVTLFRAGGLVAGRCSNIEGGLRDTPVPKEMQERLLAVVRASSSESSSESQMLTRQLLVLTQEDHWIIMHLNNLVL